MPDLGIAIAACAQGFKPPDEFRAQVEFGPTNRKRFSEKSVHRLPLCFRDASAAEGALVAALLIAGSLNGFAVDIAASLEAEGGSAAVSFFGVSPLLLASLAIAAYTLAVGYDAPESAPMPPAAVLIFCGLVLIPSSLVSWVAVGLFGGVLAINTEGRARIAALIFVGAAGVAFWSAAIEPRAASLFLPFDAAITARLLSIFREAPPYDGNLVGDAGGHRIIILAACSPFHVLPLALLGWRALVLMAQLSEPESEPAAVNYRTAQKGFFLIVAIFAAAYARLMAMAWSPEVYAFAHGSGGQALFDCVMVLLIVAAAMPARVLWRQSGA